MEEQASLSSIIIKYSVAFLMVIIILISVLGNLLVCLAICVERRLRNSGAGNFFLISLAFADLFVGLIVMPFSLASEIFNRWVFGELLCRVWISFDVMSCTSSILNLCAICIDRFLHIKDPYNYNTYMSRKNVVLIIFLIWLVSATISFVPLNLGWHKLDIFQLGLAQPHETSSNNVQFTNGDQAKQSSKLSIDQQSSEENSKCDLGFSPLYAVVSSSISFYLPSIIMVALYTRLYLCARKHVRDIRKQCKPQLITQPKRDSPLKSNNNNLLACQPQQGSNRSCRSASGNQQSSAQRTTTVQQHIADHKAAITIGIILSAFLLCWLPFFLMNITLSFCNNCVPESVFQILTWLGWCNSALNPIIYPIFNKQFRQAFIRLLTTCPLGNCSICSLLKLKRYSGAANAAQPPSNIQQPLELKCTGSSECSQLVNNNIEHQQQKQQQQQQQQTKTAINIRPTTVTNILSNIASNSGGLAKQEIIQLPFNEKIKKQAEHRPEDLDLNINNNVHPTQQTSTLTHANKSKSEKKMMMVSITNLNSKDAVISRV